MYKLAEQIIKDKKRINAPAYYGIQQKRQNVYDTNSRKAFSDN